MLHILLLILKIIGIVIAVLLGLLLFAVLVVLFVPIRYRFEGKKYSDIVVKGKVTWAFGLVHLRILYLQEKLSIVLRIAGYRFFDNNDSGKKKQKNKKQKNKKQKNKKHQSEVDSLEIEKELNSTENKSNDPIMEINHQNKATNNSFDTKKENDLSETDTESDNRVIEDEFSKISENKENVFSDLQSIDKFVESLENEEEFEEESEGKISFLRRLNNKLKQVCVKVKRFFITIGNKIKNLKNVFRKLIGKFLSIWKLIQGLWEKKSKVVAFFQLEENKAGIKLGLFSIWRLLKHIAPTKAKGYIHFGSGDPATTGQALGAAAAFYGYYGKYVKVEPDFEEEVLEGELFIKGRIRLFNLLIIGIKLLRDENFKRFIKNTKLLKEEIL